MTTTAPECVGEAEMRRLLASACEAAGSQAAWARSRGFSPSYVSLVLRGERDITEAVANSLGYLRRVTFTRLSTKGNP